MGADQNTVQGTIVGITTVVCTLENSALDALIGILFHETSLLFM